MTQDEVLLQAILENLDDDTPRLVYADWLQERGDLHGEFIHVQCMLEGMSPDDPRRAGLEALERRLLPEMEKRLAWPLDKLVLKYHIRRGFVSEVTLKAEKYPERAEALLRLAPTAQAHLTDANAEHVAALAASPHLTRVAGLSCHFSGLGDEGLRALLASRHLDRLTHLDLYSCSISPAGVESLASTPQLAALTSLELGLSGHYGANGLRNEVGVRGAQAVAKSPYLKHLTVLKLGGDPEYTIGNDIGREGAEALAASANLANLTSLDLSCNHIDDLGAQALAASPHLSCLTQLDLRGNDITDAGVQALIDSPHLDRLTSLGLSSNPGGPAISFGYDWDGSCVYAESDSPAFERLQARFRQSLRIL
jgi:uncharacterized protein (TIGR02996 family)